MDFLLPILLLGFIVAVWRTAVRMRTGPDATPDPGELYRIAATVYERFAASAAPSDLLEYDNFLNGVEHLRIGGYSTADLLGYYRGDNPPVACMALEALASRTGAESQSKELLEGINDGMSWVRFFALRALEKGGHPGPLVGPVLAKIDRTWDEPFCRRFLRDFLAQRRSADGKLSFSGDLGDMTHAQAEAMIRFLPRLDEEFTRDLVVELRAWCNEQIDVDALNAIGRVWEAMSPADVPIEHNQIRETVARLTGDLQDTPRRSVVLVGESGVGKSSIIGCLGNRLQNEGWTLFEAGHAELLAGMSYMGQFEERLRQVLSLIGGHRRVLWVVPDFGALSWAGSHQQDPTSALDFFLPHIERGDITVIGEITPDAHQRLLQRKARCRSALESLRIEPLARDQTLELAHEWCALRTAANAPPILSDESLAEAWSLTQQFEAQRVAPGNLLHVLGLTYKRLDLGSERVGTGPPQIRLDDLVETLGQLTGLPAAILSERETLDLASLRSLFESRVMGQDEAVDCLVERVAMIKAGVTDSTRPLGVFLFAGPTGTGKSEIAKTLAEFLFGSPDRLLRLDMSELQDEASLARLLGERSQRDEDGGALTDMIRKQPFSVVLLDEFEKAHPRIWDLFLQVYDDGRLTDRQGRTSDFRHSLIIMTSNVGSEVSSALGVGFLDEDTSFHPQATERAVASSFRKEFLNRIDRIVIFQPLSRQTMRHILHKELGMVFERRGLRNRSWAVEWDASAIEFLLEKGFTADLGARPLRRAIERYLLTPLSLTIVDHQIPEGDQFLFISAGSEDDLAVEFVDPEGDVDEHAVTVAAAEPSLDTLRLESVILSPRASTRELELLRQRFTAIEQATASSDFQGVKQAALELTAEPDFWESAERFAILGDAEYIARIESGVLTARSLFERLARLSGAASTTVCKLFGRLAQQLYLLEHACEDVRQRRAHEAFLLVEARLEIGPEADSGNEFALRIGRMYRSWSDKRGMSCDLLEERPPSDNEPYRLLLSISGYGAYAFLEGETGLHVFESPDGSRKRSQRRTVRVFVTPRSATRPAAGRKRLKQQALQDLAAVLDAPPQVVRYYREEPSPLVRDSRHSWRSGRLDRVLGGDFDLMGAA